MAEMWYYTSEGKQMEPVTNAELKQLAASGMLKPTDMVWKDGMAKWVRASSTQDLFSDDGMTPLKKKAAFQEDPTREDGDDRPRRGKRRDSDRYEDEDEDRPRRRRRSADKAGMDTGLKVGLILGGSLLGIALIVVVIIIATRSGNNAQAKFKPVNPPINPQMIPFNNPPPMNNGPMVVNPGNMVQPPVFRGPLAVGPGGLVFNERLTNTDPRDVARFAPCKVFAVNMTAGKTYTIRYNSTNNDNFNNKNVPVSVFDPYLRLEDSNFRQLAQDDDSGGFPNALLIYRPAQTGVYRVIATSFGGTTGSFSLQITEN